MATKLTEAQRKWLVTVQRSISMGYPCQWIPQPIGKQLQRAGLVEFAGQVYNRSRYTLTPAGRALVGGE